MPISEGFKNIKPWASAPTADRTAPDDASLTPPLVVADGWPASFSSDDGNTPRRPVFNEQYHRETVALTDVRNYGILPWDAEVDTLQGGLKQVAGVAYRALVDNGPSYGNAVSPTTAGQAVWEVWGGVISDPSAPDAPMATAPRSGELDWFWNCPLDGGAQVTEFDFQWRPSGTGSWSSIIAVNTARAVLTGLTNGQPIEARVRARSSHGVGPWSAVGTATPTGTIPGGGSTLALRAVAGDAQVSLSWLEPDDGGVTITGYTVQWRTDDQAFSSGRQTTVTDTEATVGSLTNGTTYYFRVRAVNGEGNGAWSNEAGATPVEDVPDQAIPDAADAPTGQAGNGEATWIATPPSDNGAEITGYIWRFRRVGAPSWSSPITRSIPALTRTGLTNGQTYEAQVRTRNSVGTQTSWSPSGQATPQADVPDQVAFVYLANESNGIRAEWGAPEANGSPILDYTVELDDSSGFGSPSRATVTSRSRLFTGLAEGTTYYARVRARNARGNGAWSPTRSLARDDGVDVPSALPSAPDGNPLGGSILWTWGTPVDNGARITGYELQWREEGNAWSGNVVTGIVGGAYTLEGVTGGETYEARVRARNSAGAGAWSPTGSATAATGPFYERTTAGAETFNWPWSTDRALAIIVGASGGDGGGGGGGGQPFIPNTGNERGLFAGDHGEDGVAGGDGGDSSVTIGSDTYTADGGEGGEGGGAGTGQVAAVVRGDNFFQARGGRDAPDGNGGGAGGGGGGGGGGDGGAGSRGDLGDIVVQTLVGLSQGDTIELTVGAGGDRGTGGAGGAGTSTSGSPGSDGPNAGSAGRVILIPLF